jgi:acyl-coenzyme A thioesterase PaaI-like protein
VSIQDQLGEQPCWGCGPNSPNGLRIKSYWRRDHAVCEWQPQPDHVGWPGVLNGGILAAVVDCHCIATAIADASQLEARLCSSPRRISFATASLSIQYLRPVPIDAPISLEARILDREGRKSRVSCSVTSNATLCATAEVLAIRLTAPLSSTP